MVVFALCSSSTTHVVSENNTGDEVEVWIKKQETEGKVSSSSVSLLDISWLTESMARGSPVPIQDRHRLKVIAKLLYLLLCYGETSFPYLLFNSGWKFSRLHYCWPLKADFP